MAVHNYVKIAVYLDPAAHMAIEELYHPTQKFIQKRARKTRSDIICEAIIEKYKRILEEEAKIKPEK